MLRDYQQRSIDEIYSWMRENKGHPCSVLPTGAGKSHIVAALCKDAVQSWPGTRILMTVHTKELISQNAEKMREHWRGAPLGIVAASLRKKEFGEPITFGSIQSIHRHAERLGHIDLMIVDECDLINHKDEGTYRNLINDLMAINPDMRVIGLTATPFRLGHGLITEGGAIFDALLEPVSIEELIHKGYLSKLSSKPTTSKLDASGVGKRGGDYIESQLQAALDTDDNNRAVVSEVIGRADGRKAWLFFCTGISHAEHVRDILKEMGVTAECVTGKTPPGERDRIIKDYKAGKIKALTNANVLTVGFDYPDIDLIVMMRPTMSPRLYMQMAGRGLRLKCHTDHCLVLDFAGVVQQHGPITNVRKPGKKSDKPGEAPVKVCDNCHELCHLSAIACPVCLTPFPEPEKKPLMLYTDDIMGKSGRTMDVMSWSWRKHVGAKSGIEMVKVTYYGALSEKPVTEYHTIFHSGPAGAKAIKQIMTIAHSSGAKFDNLACDHVCAALNDAVPPKSIEYIMEGRFPRLLDRSWINAETQDA